MFKIDVPEKIKKLVWKNYLIKNVPLPTNFYTLDRMTVRPSHFIIHDSNCLSHRSASLSIDTEQPAIGEIKTNNISIERMKEVNYHFIVDKIDRDYEVVMGRPIQYMCDHPDINKGFRHAIHILFLTDFNIDMPKSRLYKIVAYKCIAPLMKMLKIPVSDSSVQYHKDILIKNFQYKRKKDVDKCPGDFLLKALLTNQVKKYM